MKTQKRESLKIWSEYICRQNTHYWWEKRALSWLEAPLSLQAQWRLWILADFTGRRKCQVDNFYTPLGNTGKVTIWDWKRLLTPCLILSTVEKISLWDKDGVSEWFCQLGGIRPSSERRSLNRWDETHRWDKTHRSHSAIFSVAKSQTLRRMSLSGWRGAVFNMLLRPGHLSEYQSRLWCFSITASEMQE